MRQIKLLLLNMFIVPICGRTVYVCDDFSTKIIWTHQIKRLKLSHKHYEVHTKGNKVQLRALKKDIEPTELTLISADGTVQKIQIVYDSKKAKTLYDLNLRGEKNKKSMALDEGYLKLALCKANANIKIPVGVVKSIMRFKNVLYVSIKLNNTKATDVESTLEGETDSSLETDYTIEKGEMLIKIKTKDFKKKLTMILLDIKGKELSKFTIKPSRYV